jgi:hypothetical protein
VLRAVRRDLDLERALAAADGAERPADVPGGVGPAGEQPLDLVGAGRRGQVEVVVPSPQHRVAHRAAHQGQLVPGIGEARSQLVDDGRDPVELGGHVALGVGQPNAPRRSAFCCVGHVATA